MCSREVEGWKLGGDEAQMGDVWPVGSIPARAVMFGSRKGRKVSYTPSVEFSCVEN